jgi:UDP-N-acetylglucosamine/UDP-N-acetylgalactosamine diphosphorylase
MSSSSPDPQALRERFEAAGQGHVFAHWDDLDASRREALLEQLAAVDLDWVRERYEQYRAEQSGEETPPALEPAPVITLPESEEEKRRAAAAREAGEEALRAGKLAAFLVAGGQGTRLGFEGPKGAYPIGPVTERSLFQYHAEQIRARGERYGVAIPWYIMTSEANDAATRSFFAEHDHFGLAPADIMFFQQAMVPALDFEGRLILEAPDRLAMNPNGHGGSLFALARSGATADMRSRGVETISYFQVDNALTTICDPVFAGYHRRAGAEMSSKVLEKCAPEEKVGVICYRDGKLGVVEYSDLDEELACQTDEDGRLRFWAGSIAIHMLDVDFVDRVGGGAGQLPWHTAIKKIPCLGPEGESVSPAEPNGVKFETFVFDALPLAAESVTMEVCREEEFAPVKNPTGVDSVESARQLLTDYAARRLREAGAEVPTDGEGHARVRLELSYRYALDAADLAEKLREPLALEPGETLVLEP